LQLQLVSSLGDIQLKKELLPTSRVVKLAWS
jgi:hypothetical protein